MHHDDNIRQDVQGPAITILTLVQIKLQEQVFLWRENYKVKFDTTNI
jgi:hypothetical protein